MDVEQQVTAEQALLGHAKRQTAALETLRNIALFWTIAIPTITLIWLIVMFH